MSKEYYEIYRPEYERIRASAQQAEKETKTESDSKSKAKPSAKDDLIQFADLTHDLEEEDEDKDEADKPVQEPDLSEGEYINYYFN